MKRDDLVEHLCDRVRTWMQLNRHLESNSRRVEQLRVIANELLPALKKAAASLRKIGAHKSREAALTSHRLRAQEFLRLSDDVGPFHTEDWLLNLAVTNAMRDIEGFAVGQPGRPMEFCAALAGELDRILRESGCSKFEREYFFAHVNASRKLPPLPLETARKRAQRGSWSPAEREYFRPRRTHRKTEEKGTSARRGTN